MFFNNLIFSKQCKPMVWCFDYNFKNGVVDHYVADITTALDYPFGSPMDGRTFYSEKYRFGFNGKACPPFWRKKDNEVAGAGNTNTALFWEYDTRLGRRWNLDPKSNPSISDYACFANKPIFNCDPLGDTIRIAGANTLCVNDFPKNGAFFKEGVEKLFNGKVSIEYVNSEATSPDLSVKFTIKDGEELNAEEQLIFNYFVELNSQKEDFNISLNGNDDDTKELSSRLKSGIFFDNDVPFPGYSECSNKVDVLFNVQNLMNIVQNGAFNAENMILLGILKGDKSAYNQMNNVKIAKFKHGKMLNFFDYKKLFGYDIYISKVTLDNIGSIKWIMRVPENPDDTTVKQKNNID